MEVLNYEGLQLYHELASEKFANSVEVQAALTNLNDNKVDKDGNKVLSTNDYTTAEKDKLANINAFSNITNGTTTITADSATDTLTLEAGSNITLNLDSTNDKITISAATYDAAGSNLGLVKSGGDVTISSGVITVNDDSHNHSNYALRTTVSAIEGRVDNLEDSVEAIQKVVDISADDSANTIDTISEIIGYIQDNEDAISIITNKQDKNLGSTAANKVLVTDASGNIAASSDITTTELGYLNGVTSSIQTQLNGKVNQNTYDTAMANKVDKVSGKGLSTNDFTTAYKNKLDGIATGANNYSLPTASSSTKGGVRTGAAISDTTGYTAVHIKDGVIYYKDTDTDTHYTTRLYIGASGTASNSTTTNPYLKITDDNIYRNQIRFVGSGATTISSDTNGNITISSTDTQTVSSVNNKTGAVSLSYSDVSAAPTSHASSSTTYGASSSSNYGHAKASSTTPKANGTASTGTETSSFARGDHVHPSQTTISGNAGSATTLQNTRYIDGISFNGSANVTRYATCSTSASTVAKTASITEGTFNLNTGARVTVKFSNANSATNPTLNINSTGAKAIYWHGSNIPNTQFWEAGATLDFVYNGTQYELIGVAKDNDSPYSVYNSKITLSPGTGLSGGGDFTINQSSAETITFNLANTSVTSGSYGPSSNASPQAGGTFSVPYITVDAQGRLTAASTKTITLPSDSDTHHSAYLYLGGAGASSNATSAVSDPYLNLRENNTNRSSIQIKGGTNISISGSNGIITINSTATSSDTKVNMTSNSTTKAYLLGTTTTPSSSTQAVTSIADSGVYLGTSSGELVATQFTGYLNGTANLAATANKLGTSSKGSSLQPIYLNAGSPEAVSYVGVNYGGTGATTKSGARENLGINSGTSLPSSGTSGDIFFLYS